MYIIPGFGGNHVPPGAYAKGGPAAGKGEVEFIRVYLSGRCKWGHHVYADSATNGPRGRSLRDPRRQSRFELLVQRIQHPAIRLRSCPCSGNGVEGLPHFRPGRRDEIVCPRPSRIDDSHGSLDDGKPFPRNFRRPAIYHPHAENPEQAQADEQQGNCDSGRACCLLNDCHAQDKKGEGLCTKSVTRAFWQALLYLRS